MTRVAVFGDPSLRRRLRATTKEGLAYEFFPPPAGKGRAAALPRRFAGALVEAGRALKAQDVRRVRQALPGRPVGGLVFSPDAAILRRLARLELDFVVEGWRPGDPPARAVLAHVKGARRGAHDADGERSAQRLAVLIDVVKTANSLLEPGKVVEVVMEKIRELIPSEAWSLLMVDEEKEELVFEAAHGARGPEVSSYRIKIGEGVAGWVAQTAKPAIVNDTSRDRRFDPALDSRTRFESRSILCAPLVSRGRTIGVLELINRLGGRFTRADLDLMLTLVEPCAIALENAILFQRTEQLTITDDLTRLFNSRYLNLYLGREIKRCKRHGIPLSVIFLDLDGFKGINDQYGHLAGSGTLTEVGAILAEGVRESDILARYGGDEFVVVLPETPASGALVIAERLRRMIEENHFLEAQGLSARISASFGIAAYPDHALTPEALIQKADQAMYRVKEREKNGIEVAV